MNLRNLTINSVRIILITLLSVVLFACSDDDNKKEIPTPPQPEKPATASVTPHKIELTIHWGHLHGSLFHANVQPKGSPLRRMQTITFEKNGEKWEQVASTNEDAIAIGKSVVFIGGSTPEEKEGGRYSVEIVMYDKEGNRINTEVTNKAKRFQVFFNATDFKNIETKESDNTLMKDAVFNYKYRDTNPEQLMFNRDADAKLAETNIGLKGYFAIGKPYISYNLHINLMEWTKKDKAENLPFNQNIEELSDVAKVFSLVLPIDVPSTHPATDAEVEKHTAALGKYFGMPADKIDDLEYWGDYINPESSKYWM